MKKLISIFTILFCISISISGHTSIDVDVGAGGGLPGQNTEDGSSDGQMLFWDSAGNVWRHTETTEFWWDDTTKKIKAVSGAELWGATIKNNNGIAFENAAETDYFQIQLDPNQTNEAAAFTAPASNQVIFFERSDFGLNFNLPVQLTPTVFFHSGDQTKPYQWGKITHDATNFVLYSNDGVVQVQDGLESAGRFYIRDDVAEINFYDTDTVNNTPIGNIWGVATDTGAGTEDADFIFFQKINGADSVFINADADQYLELGAPNQLTATRLFGIVDVFNPSGFYGFFYPNPDNGLMIGVSSTDGKSNFYEVLTSISNVTKDHGLNTPAPDPTRCVFSADNVDVDDTKKLCETHDGDNAIIYSGKGNIKLDPSTGGSVEVDSARLLLDQGANVASSNDITLGTDGNYFIVTGTTQVNTIASTGWVSGSSITIEASASLTLAHNTAGTGSSLFLEQGNNYVMAAGDIAKLMYNGTYWKEISRTTF